MKNSYLKLFLYLLIFGSFALSLSSCNNNDDNSMHYDSELKNITFKNTTVSKTFVHSGTFEGVSHSVILPGESVTINFSAAKKQFLHFATMFGASKDWFFAPNDTGLKLFDDSGNAIIGDVSDQIFLWDNGTKNNITGENENSLIKKLPINASKLVKLFLTYDKKSSIFNLTITNTSNETEYETLLSPGIWAVSNFNGNELFNKKPFFSENHLSSPELTDIAEHGNNTKFDIKLKNDTGIITNISKVIVVVYEGNQNPLFTVNTFDNGNGIKNLAQKGDTTYLVNYLKTLKNVKKIYITNDGLAPEDSQSLNIEIKTNQNIAFATMFAYSNDWFISSNTPITNTIKGEFNDLIIYDSGTGINQFPGAGNNQALFGGNPEVEYKKIKEIPEGEYPNLKSANSYLKIMFN